MVTRKEINASKERQKKAKKKFKGEQAIRDSEKNGVRKEKIKLKPKKKGVVRRVIDKVKEGRKKAVEKRPKLTKGLEVSAGVLGVSAAALTGVGVATGAIGTGVGAATLGTGATRIATKGGEKIIKLPNALTKIGTKINVDAIGKSAGLTTDQTAALAKRIGFERINVLARYAVNPKSQGLTNSLLKKAGMTTGALAIIGTFAGTYPFAKFELAEATDKIGIAIFRASQAGDQEEVNRLVQTMDEMLDETVWEKIKSKIPFINVLQSVNKNIAAAQVSAKSIKSTVGKEVNETVDFAESQETARQTKLEQRARDAEYFNLIREGKFEEAEELLNQELEGGK